MSAFIISKFWRRHLRSVSAVFLLAGFFILASVTLQGQPAPSPSTDFWFTDGPVNAIQIVDHTIYIGGDFSYVGPQTGPIAIFDLATGNSAGRMPRVNGTVYAIESDGASGWFIAGDFTKIGTYSRTCVAHILADFTVDPAFDAKVTGSSISALGRVANRLYLGGNFTKIAGVNRRALGAVDRETGALDDTWNPNLDGRVNVIVLSGNLIYIGGSFSTAGAATRNNLAAVDLLTAKATDWNPNADRQVLALALDDATAYVGGEFTTVGTKPRNRLAALDLSTGVALTWAPNPNAIVRSIVATDSAIYVGGDFATAGGQSRNRFAALNRSTGQALPLNLLIEGTSVSSVRIAENTIYVGGSFTRAQGRDSLMLAAANLTTGDPVDTVPLGTRFNGSQNDAAITSICIAGDKIVFGGSFKTLGGVARSHVAALSQTTGGILPWHPVLSDPVQAMATSSDTIFLGGAFTNVNGTPSSGLAAVDEVYGETMPDWGFYATNGTSPAEITCLLATPDRLFLGGRFNSVVGQAVRTLAAVDLTNGTPLAFDARITGGSQGIFALASVENRLFFSGDFTGVGGQSRTRLAAVTADRGQLDPWAPAPNQKVTSLSTAGGYLFVGGDFTRISGLDLRQLAVYDTTLLENRFWDVAFSSSSGGISAIASTDTSVFISGEFNSIGGEFHNNLACLSAAFPQAYAWDPSPNEGPAVISLSDNLVCLGGSFRTLATQNYFSPGFFAVYQRNPLILSNQFSGGKLNFTTTTGDRTRAVIESTTNFTSWSRVKTNDAPGFTWIFEAPVSPASKAFFRVVAE